MKNLTRSYVLFAVVLLIILYPTTVLAAKDKTKPVISSVSATPSITNNTSQTITVKFKLSEKAKVKLKVYKGSTLVKTGLNGVDKEGNVTWSWTGSKQNGKYTVKIDAVDRAGNNAITKKVIVNIDTIKPNFAYIDADSSSLVQSEEIAFDPDNNPLEIYYSLSETARVTVKAYGGAYPNGYLLDNHIEIVDNYYYDSTFEWDGLFGNEIATDGEYRIDFTATDAAGNVSATKSITVILDTVTPSLLPASGLFEKNIFNWGEENTLNYQANEPVIALLTITNANQKMVYINLVGTFVEDALDITNTIDFEEPDLLDGEILKYFDDIKIPEMPKYESTGSIKWNGKDMLGNIVAEGAYTYKLILMDRVGKIKVNNGTVNLCDGFAPMIATQSIDTPFTPTGSNNVGIKFTLSKAATVNIKIYKDNVFVKELNNISSVRGDNTVNWNGKDYDDKLVGAGTYTYKINGYDIANNNGKESIGTLIVQ